MYIVPDMIDLGLEEGQTWPSPVHKEVAQAIALTNPNVNTRDTLMAIVKVVNQIPQNKIEKITYNQLIRKGLPDVGMYR